MSFQYKIRGEQFVQFERQSQDYIEQRDQDLESSLSYDFSNLDADNLTSGTVPSARIAGSYTGITGVGALTVGSVPATLLTGTTLPAAITASSLTSVGTLSALDVTGTFEVSPSVNHTLYVSGNRVGVRTNTPQGAFDVVGTAFASAFTAAGTVTANLFSGSGASLTSIPNSATTATNTNTASAIVARSAAGNFSGSQITATLFSGSGASLTSIPAGQLTGTVASARISGAYTGFTSITASNEISFGNALFQTNLPTSGAGTDAEFVTVGGNYYIYRNTSTRKDKENIQPLNAIVTPSMVDAINVQLWNRKTAPGIPEIGPIAEDMHDISPFLSAKGVDFDADGNMISKEPEGINKNAWLSLLTIAIQDLRQRLQQLETT